MMTSTQKIGMPSSKRFPGSAGFRSKLRSGASAAEPHAPAGLPGEVLSHFLQALHLLLILGGQADRSRAGIVKALKEAAAQEHSQGGPAVLPGRELLLLARMVTDGHFENLAARLDHAGRDLRLDLEAAAFHRQRAGQGTRNELVAGLHIVDAAAIEQVGHAEI